MTRTTLAWPKPAMSGATAWSLVVASLVMLGVGEPTDGNINLYSSGTALRSTGRSALGATAPMDLVAADDEKTTSPPDDEATTTPVPPETPVSIMWAMKKAVTKELYRSHYQWVNALLAFIFGIVMVVDGQDCFKWLVVATAFLLAAVLAMSEVSELWELGDQSKVRHFVGIEVGAVGACAAWLGFEGVMIVIGAILGGFVSFSVQGKLVSWGVTSLAKNKWAIVFLYTLFTAGSALIFYFKKHVKGVAVLSAAIGGALVSSALSWFITHLAALGYLGSIQGLTPVPGAWIEFFSLLWSSSAADRGLFVNSSYNFQISGQEYHLDRIMGCAFWLVLFIVGAVVQLRALKARVAQARGPRGGILQEALLHDKQ